MVSPQLAWMLKNTLIDPLTVARAFSVSESQCWKYLEDLDRALGQAEAGYRADFDQRRLDLQEFVDSLDSKEIRRKALIDKLYAAKRNPQAYSVQRLLQEFKALKSGDSEQVTQQHILTAKSRSIRDMLNVTRQGNVSCPFHKDKTPSFQIRKDNTFTCYSCGEHGDVIDLYRLMHSCDFKTAVKALC